MTKSADQTVGTYQLAGGANGFSGSLALYVGDGNDCGSLSVGSCLDYNGKQYCLERTNGVLALRIA